MGLLAVILHNALMFLSEIAFCKPEGAPPFPRPMLCRKRIPSNTPHRIVFLSGNLHLICPRNCHHKR